MSIGVFYDLKEEMLARYHPDLLFSCLIVSKDAIEVLFRVDLLVIICHV